MKLLFACWLCINSSLYAMNGTQPPQRLTPRHSSQTHYLIDRLPDNIHSNSVACAKQPQSIGASNPTEKNHPLVKKISVTATPDMFRVKKSEKKVSSCLSCCMTKKATVTP